MKIHEYQAKQLFAKAGVPIPRGVVVHSAAEAAAAYQELGTPVAVVKSQIHAGGRGKGRFKEHPEQAGVDSPLRGLRHRPASLSAWFCLLERSPIHHSHFDE